MQQMAEKDSTMMTSHSDSSFQQIQVSLVDAMGSDLSVVNSARVSFNSQSSRIEERDIKLINYLAKNKHMTPFRHNALQIRVTAPIFLARQLGKHQAGLSWNEISRRYVDEPPKFYLPENFHTRPEGSIKQGCGKTHELSTEYRRNIGRLYQELGKVYEHLIQTGIAPEEARAVLPQSMMTSWYWTGNLLAFAHVYKERSHPSAQTEARMFAEQLGRICAELFPISWKALTEDA